MKLLALDVSYNDDTKMVGIGAAIYNDENSNTDFHYLDGTYAALNIQPYVSGEFYKRELPCLKYMIDLLVRLNKSWDLIIIDGFVWLQEDNGSGDGQGLGAHLYYEYMDWPVIGVAKTPYRDAPAAQVIRGKRATKPLHVTSIDIDLNGAAEIIRDLPGDFRIPDLLRAADNLSKAVHARNT